MTSRITVEMLDGKYPLLRFPTAFATKRRPDGTLERFGGQINLSIETLEEAKTLRDALSAFIEFHRRLPPLDQSAHFVPTEEQLQYEAEAFIAGAS